MTLTILGRDAEAPTARRRGTDSEVLQVTQAPGASPSEVLKIGRV